MKMHPETTSLCSDNSSYPMKVDNLSSMASPCEDIWKKFDDFLLTPPQSPPVEFGSLFADPLDESISLALDDFLQETNCLSDTNLVEVINSFENESIDVVNDCMWSGPSFEEVSANIAEANTYVNKCRERKSDTHLLGTSPLAMSCTFTEILTCDDVDIDDEDSNDVPAVQDDASSSSGFVSGSESLIDHSYGSPKCPAKTSPPPPSSSTAGAQSLIYPPPDYKKVITRSKKRAQRESALSAPPVTVKFVKRPQTSNILAVNGKNGFRKPVKQCKSARVKKLLTIKAASSTVATLSTSTASSSATAPSSPSPSKPGSPKNSKFVVPEKKRDHNVSERKRRDLLRSAFHCLRDQVPKFRESDKKPARIVILHEASSYVQQLVDKHRYLEKTKQAEERKREKLLARLASLK